jgi:hypothetical protein
MWLPRKLVRADTQSGCPHYILRRIDPSKDRQFVVVNLDSTIDRAVSHRLSLCCNFTALLQNENANDISLVHNLPVLCDTVSTLRHTSHQRAH